MVDPLFVYQWEHRKSQQGWNAFSSSPQRTGHSEQFQTHAKAMQSGEPTAWLLALMGVVAFPLALVTFGKESQMRLRARSPAADTPVTAFVTFVGEFVDDSPVKALGHGARRSSFGWGASGIISEAVREIAPVIQNCRQYKSSGAEDRVRLDVKVEPGRPGFRVVGLVEGAESQPKMAACMREKINAARFSRLAALKPVPEDAYRLRVEVHSNIGVELPKEISADPENEMRAK